MPLSKLTLRPGINTEYTPTLNEGGWSGSNRVRFWYGLPQKIGGWLRATADSFVGICRGLLGWTELSGTQDIALGTNLKLFIFQGGAFNDITPVRDSGTLGADPFTTSNGSSTVTVADTGHGLSVGDFAIFSGAAAFNNVTISGEYQVVTVVDADHYTITAGTLANATGAGGGAAVDFTYLIPVGPADSTPGLGWGIGPWGGGTWDTPRSVAGRLLPARTWSMDTWTDDLIANPYDGGIYLWDASTGASTRATVISGAPTLCKFIMVTSPERHLAAFGCSDSGGTQDARLIRWSDTEDYTTWTATATNAAGSYRITTGSKIQAAIKSKQEMLIWTDNSLTSMRFTGPPYVFGFDQLGVECGLVAPNAATAYMDVVYWMEHKNFYTYDGTIKVLPCDVWDSVFGNMNTVQAEKFFACTNSSFNEVWFWWCSANSDEIDSYTIYNTVEHTWALGQIPRTAWCDHNVFDTPIATSPSSMLYFHETGYDDDSSPMTDVYLESGFFDIGDGTQFVHWASFMPDFTQIGDIIFYASARKFPDSAPWQKGPYTVTADTTEISVRIRGRQAQIRIEMPGTTSGEYFRMGAPRVNTTPDGRR